MLLESLIIVGRAVVIFAIEVVRENQVVGQSKNVESN